MDEGLSQGERQRLTQDGFIRGIQTLRGITNTRLNTTHLSAFASALYSLWNASEITPKLLAELYVLDTERHPQNTTNVRALVSYRPAQFDKLSQDQFVEAVVRAMTREDHVDFSQFIIRGAVDKVVEMADYGIPAIWTVGEVNESREQWRKILAAGLQEARDVIRQKKATQAGLDSQRVRKEDSLRFYVSKNKFSLLEEVSLDEFTQVVIIDDLESNLNRAREILTRRYPDMLVSTVQVSPKALVDRVQDAGLESESMNSVIAKLADLQLEEYAGRNTLFLVDFDDVLSDSKARGKAQALAIAKELGIKLGQ